MFNLRCSGYLVCLFSALNDTAVVPAHRLRVTGFKPWTGSTALKKPKESNRFGWFPTQVRLSWSTWSAECGSDFGCVNANLSANWQLQFKTRTRETDDIRTCFKRRQTLNQQTNWLHIRFAPVLLPAVTENSAGVVVTQCGALFRAQTRDGDIFCSTSQELL